MSDTEKFNNYLLGVLGTTEADNRMKGQILNVHTIMSKYKSFTKLQMQEKLDYCVTIIRIAVNTASEDLSKIKSSNKDRTFEYSIYKNESRT